MLGRGGHCLFCSSLVNRRTKEHVLAQWLAAILPGEGMIVVSTASDAPGFTPRTWTKRGVDITVRQVCEACNSGWLSDLENTIKGVLTHMVLGRSVVLSPLEQDRLAAWIYKTALMFALTNPSGAYYFANHDYTAFKAHLRPPHGTRAWLAAYNGREQWTTWYRKRVLEITRQVSQEDSETREGHSMVATLGPLVLVQFTSRWETIPWAVPPISRGSFPNSGRYPPKAELGRLLGGSTTRA
jgi:hypothetical protein